MWSQIVVDVAALSKGDCSTILIVKKSSGDERRVLKYDDCLGQRDKNVS